MATEQRTTRTASRSRHERGAGTLEYTGMTIVAALAGVALLLATPGLTFGQTFGDAVCSVLQRDSGCLHVPGTTPTQTPYERATSGRYVAMGDSYSSGEGAWDYEPDTNTEGNACHRSSNAYSRVLGRTNDFKGGTDFVACSGAREQHINDGNRGEDPQISALGPDVSLVTMSMGGNDMGFAEVIKDCITNGERGLFFVEKCQRKHDQRMEDELPRLRQELIDRYREIRATAPNARVVIVGYPQLFVDDPDDNFRNLLFKEDQVWMNEKAAELNAMLAEAAREAGVEFVDPTNAFRDHGLGSQDPWINDFSLGGPGVNRFDYSASFHPNAAGHAALAQLVQQQLEHPK